MTVLLSSQALSKAYGPRPLFTNIALDLRAGECLGLIGPNGSGKSTLLKLLAGVETPDGGTVALRRLGSPAQELVPLADAVERLKREATPPDLRVSTGATIIA